MCFFSVSLRIFTIFFFFQAEDGIRDVAVTGVQTCALPIWSLAILAFAIAAFAALDAHAHRSIGVIAASELGIVAFYVIIAFARRVQADHERTRGLLAELEATRHSHEEAAALRERGRIAREMHDVLAHSLSGLMLQLEGAR